VLVLRQKDSNGSIDLGTQTCTALFTAHFSANTGIILKVIRKIKQKQTADPQLAQSDVALLMLIKALTPVSSDDLTSSLY